MAIGVMQRAQRAFIMGVAAFERVKSTFLLKRTDDKKIFGNRLAE